MERFRISCHANRHTPYARKQRALEEQAFYDRFGKISTVRPFWARFVASLGTSPRLLIGALRSS